VSTSEPEKLHESQSSSWPLPEQQQVELYTKLNKLK